MLTAPLDLIKIRYQIQKLPRRGRVGQSIGLARAVRSIYQEEGLRSFWRGNFAATLLWISYSGAQFGVYKVLLTTSDSPMLLGIHGAIAGTCAASLTYPFDLMRTVFAAQGVPRVYPNMTSLVKTTYRTYGLRGFYRGITPSLVQIGPYIGCSFFIYESLKRWHVLPNTPAYYAVYGGVAGFISKLLVYPIDTVKKRMQVQGSYPDTALDHHHPNIQYTSIRDCLTRIIREEGVLGLYRGTIPSLSTL